MNVVYKEENASLIQSLNKNRSPENIHETVVKFYDRISSRINRIVTDNQLNIACERGCCYCCYLRVEVRAHEVFTIARFIHEKRSEQEMEILTNKLRSTVNAIGGLTREEHFARNIECSLLLDGECSVYSVRPSLCHKHHSMDADRCRHSFQNPSDVSIPPVGHPLVIQSTRAAISGFRDALDKVGLDSTLYELNASLLAALDHPKYGKKWRKGKKAFPRSAEAQPRLVEGSSRSSSILR